MLPDQFILFPAIDILEGKCVRLRQGRFEDSETVAVDPLSAARQWLEEGAEWLHVVDLDGAKSGIPFNTGVIRDIIETAASFGSRIQVGGGIRTQEAIEKWLEVGAARCVIGTGTMNIEWMQEIIAAFGTEVVVGGLDGRNGQLSVAGWLNQTNIPLVDLGCQLYRIGLRTALVTDVGRDGMMAGANLELAVSLQQETGLVIIASGGIRSQEEILAAERAGLAGVVVGRALYDGTVTVRQALEAVQGAAGPRKAAPC